MDLLCLNLLIDDEQLNDSSKQYTAFCTHDAQYFDNVLPMGMKTSPAVFQKFMNKVLERYIGKMCQCYLDDVVIYTGGSFEDSHWAGPSSF